MSHRDHFFCLALLAAALAGPAPAQNTAPPPVVEIEYYDAETGAWYGTPPGQGRTRLRARNPGGAAAATATWWAPLVAVHCAPGSPAEQLAIDAGLLFLVEPPQSWPTLGSLVPVPGPISPLAAAEPWCHAAAWPAGFVGLVFATGVGTPEAWSVPTWHPGAANVASPFFRSPWWDQANFWNTVLLAGGSDEKVAIDALVQQAILSASPVSLPDTFFDSELYERIYLGLEVRLQSIGLRDDHIDLATYPKQPVPWPPTGGPPPKLPSGPSQFKVTIGQPGIWVTAGVRPGFAMVADPPPVYQGTAATALRIPFVGYTRGTVLTVRSLGLNGQPPRSWSLNVRHGGVGRILVPLNLPAGDEYEVVHVRNSWFDADLLGGERARFVVVP